MDTTLGKGEQSSENSCRCCSQSFSNALLHSLFEYIMDEMELFKMLMTVAPISIFKNDGFSQKICLDCKTQVISAYRFRQMCISSDETVRSNRKPLTNNEHDYSLYINDDYDMDLSEYLIVDTKNTLLDQEQEQEQEIQVPMIDETQNFDAPAPSKKARYTCPVCGKLWVTPSKLKRHMSVHRSEKPISPPKKPSFSVPVLDPPKKDPEVQCPICFLAIESQEKLHQHMNTHIRSDPAAESIPSAMKIGKQYVCSVCGTEFKAPAKLQNHMKSMHMRKVPFFKTEASDHPPVVPEKMLARRPAATTCGVCSKSFPNSWKLLRHSKTHAKAKQSGRRPSPRTHRCIYCQKMWPTPSKLQRHLSVHQDSIQAGCSEGIEISAVTSIQGDY